MFERNLKSSNIQLRVTEDEKELIQLMAIRSPQQDVSNLIMYLIKCELDRVKEFDLEVQDFLKRDNH